MNIRRAIIIAAAVVMTTIGLAAPANATWTWSGGGFSTNAVESAMAAANPDAFVVPMATDRLGCHSYGGKIYNERDSWYGIGLITGCANNGVPPGHWSHEYYNSRDVDAFYVGPGAFCENTATGFRYNGEATYVMSSDLVSIHLFCRAKGF